MDRVILFVRHGESESNVLRLLSVQPDRYHLTARGRSQAERLSEQLSPMPIARVYSSPVLRAVETAKIIASRIGAEITIDGLLAERDHGRMNETAVPTIDAEVELYSSLEEHGIEPISLVAARAAKFMGSVNEKVVIAVTHADVIRAVVARLLDMEDDEFSSYGILPEKATITAVGGSSDGSWKILALGSPRVTETMRRTAGV
jgi:2,3-bisphosphoglycerate-dependent phosphoglycerate mutase